MMPTDPIATHILRRAWNELAGVYAPGSFRQATTLAYDAGRILVRTADGQTIEITARRLPDEPNQ